jgi:Ser/Thr protein kinase RdoA (MazF antagonist)
VPQESNEGYVLTVEDSPTGKPLHAVLYSWLWGSNVGNRLDPPLAERIGKLTAALHQHAASWHGPKSGRIKEFPGWLFFMQWVLDGRGLDASVYRKALVLADAAADKLRSARPHVVHFDLHTSNLRLHKGAISVLDFDDILLGWPALDAAISVFHNRRHEGASAIEEAYWRGLGTGPAAWGLSNADFESLVAGRAVLLVNDIFQNNNAEIAKLAQPYGEVTERRLRHFLDTGVYDPSVATMST